MHTVGDLVTLGYPKAKRLKNVILKVLDTYVGGSYNSHVVNVKGHHSDYPFYRLRNLQEIERHLQRDVEHAASRLEKCKERLRDFREQAKEAESYFPKV